MREFEFPTGIFKVNFHALFAMFLVKRGEKRRLVRLLFCIQLLLFIHMYICVYHIVPLIRVLQVFQCGLYLFVSFLLSLSRN